uniref:Uncharacterized protein n=1 Tax=virus sp. ctuWX8 TaxID=2826816 RepID=A0A8S5R739_9VIRU|nr:MAG TPA: hypothetical protein [virus sp. ctuWX8]
MSPACREIRRGFLLNKKHSLLVSQQTGNQNIYVQK